jgi:hypothetical protein
MRVMSGIPILLSAAVLAFAADDPWAKVRELKSGTEVRVYKKGSAQPVNARMDELTDENLIVVLKTEQVAIAKDQIDRIDYRPAASRVMVDSKSTTTDPDTRPGPPGHGAATPGTSTSSGLSVGSKPDFETIYKRAAPAPKNAASPPKN